MRLGLFSLFAMWASHNGEKVVSSTAVHAPFRPDACAASISSSEAARVVCQRRRDADGKGADYAAILAMMASAISAVPTAVGSLRSGFMS